MVELPFAFMRGPSVILQFNLASDAPFGCKDCRFAYLTASALEALKNKKSDTLSEVMSPSLFLRDVYNLSNKELLNNILFIFKSQVRFNLYLYTSHKLQSIGEPLPCPFTYLTLSLSRSSTLYSNILLTYNTYSP